MGKQYRRQMYKSFAEGFQEIVRAIHRLLEAQVFPTRERILKKAMPDFLLPGSNAWYHQRVRHFLDRGGDVMWALEAVVARAEDDEDRSGDDDPHIGCAAVPRH